MRPTLGGGFLPPPKQLPARASRPQAALARKRRLPRHLGASSPSGNVRGGCRGWTPWAGRPLAMTECTRHNFGFCISFRPLPVSLQEARPAFLPPHSNSNPPPRKKIRKEEGQKGRAGRRGSARRWGDG